MATIKEDYVSFEIAKLLKEKGFDAPCMGRYSVRSKEFHLDCTRLCSNGGLFEYAAPSQAMVMKWLREVHNIDIAIDAAVGMLGVKVYIPFISTYKPRKDNPSKVRQIKRGVYYKDDKGIIPALQHFDTYEEACEIAIRYCLENLI